MKKNLILPLKGSLAAAFTAFFLASSPTQAAEKVVVSVPPLHSLVSNLLTGIAEPGLLITESAALTAAPDRARIDAAGMVVWTGPAYEQGLAGVRAADPTVSAKGLTLSTTLPLLSFADPSRPDMSTGVQDMRFWLDPRLAKVAVGRIAPNLIRVFPEQSDQILENEIRLKKRLMALEARMRQALESFPGVPLHVTESDVLYLAWRFNLAVPNCPAAARIAEGFALETGTEPGAALYFAMMEIILGELRRCQAVQEMM